MAAQRFLTILLFFLSIALFRDANLIAQESLFTTELTSEYTFGPYSYSSVKHEIRAVSNQDKYYLTNYTLSAGESAILDARASNINGQLETTVDKKTISVRLPSNNEYQESQEFMLEYKLDGVLQIKGLLREIVIPLVASSPEIDVISHTVTVKIPQSWGDVQSESSPVYSYGNDDDYTIRSYSVDNGVPEIKLTVGDFQLYDVTLYYHLVNATDTALIQEVAFPPNFSSMQEVYIQSLDPLPDTIRIDSDGNYIGQYKLKKNETMTVEFNGQIKIDVQSAGYGGEVMELNDEVSLLMPDKYWEVNDPAITEIAHTLDSPRSVYDYVLQTLQYSDERVGGSSADRLGARAALDSPLTAVCMEFTDLTIALMRAARIPAREVNGFAYIKPEEFEVHPTVSDVLHAWVQYYDSERGWVNIDPTWGSTTGRDYFSSFDNDHIIFAIKGISSQFPHPAGVYKGVDADSRDVYVTFSDSPVIEGVYFDQWIEDFEYDNLSWWQKLWMWIKGLFD